MATTVGIIQARMGSRRFPGKILQKVAGIPLLDLVVSRVRRANMVDKWILATTMDKVDDCLVDRFEGLPVFRGPAENVLARFYLCAKKYNVEPADIIVRITADDPVKDAALVDRVIMEMIMDTALDYCSNTLVPTFPLGLDVEAFRMRALERAYWEAILEYDCEHVTPYICNNPDLFTRKNIDNPAGDYSKWRWTIDTREDLYAMNELFRLFSKVNPLTVKWDDLLWLIEETQPGANVAGRTDAAVR